MASPVRIACPQCGTTNRVPAGRSAAAGRCGECHVALFTSHPIAVDETGLARHLRSNDIPVLVDVWAPWCGPCRTMAPQFELAAARLEPNVRLLKLNADTAPDTCARLGVHGIPVLFLFHNGIVLAQTAGAMAADGIVRWTHDQLASQSS